MMTADEHTRQMLGVESNCERAVGLHNKQKCTVTAIIACAILLNLAETAVNASNVNGV